MNRKHLLPVIIVLSFALVVLSGFTLRTTEAPASDIVTTLLKNNCASVDVSKALTADLTAHQTYSRFKLRNIEEFHEGLAWILFQDQNKEYHIGVIDETGNLIFYFPCSELSKYNKPRVQDGYFNPYDSFFPGLTGGDPYQNGYSSIETENRVLIIDTSGKIVRSFKKPYSGYNDSPNGCLCCNAGYALISETHSGFESVETVYSIVNPQGEAKQIYSTSGKDSLSADFIYDGVVKLYKSKDSSAFIYYPTLAKMVEIERSSTTLVMTGETEWIAIYDYTGDVLKYIDDYGNKYEETIPEECRGLAFLSEVDDGYILFERGGKPCVVYNTKTHSFRTYNGKYADRVVCNPSAINYDSLYGRSYADKAITVVRGAGLDNIGNGMLSLILMGADNNRYIVLLDIDTMFELCEPFRGEGCELINGYVLVPDKEVTANALNGFHSNYTKFYDTQGHVLYTRMHPLEDIRFLDGDNYAIMENNIPVFYNSNGETYLEVNYKNGRQLDTQNIPSTATIINRLPNDASKADNRKNEVSHDEEFPQITPPQSTYAPMPTSDLPINFYQDIVNKVASYDRSIDIPEEYEVWDQPAVYYVHGSNPNSSSGGMYLLREPGNNSIRVLSPRTEVTVLASRSLNNGKRYAFVETPDMEYGWVNFQAARAEGLVSYKFWIH